MSGFRDWRRFVTTACLACLLWLFFLLVTTSGRLDFLSGFNLETYPEALALFIGVVVFILICAAPAIPASIRRWARRREILPIDAFATVLIALNLETYLFKFTAPRSSGWFAIAATVLFALLGSRAVLTIRSSKSPETLNNPISATSTDLFFSVLGEGLGPLKDFSADQLNRGPLVDSIEGILARARTPLVIGIEGPWGSGKTTILSEVQRRMGARGALVVYFDAWSCREPSRLVFAYFTSVSAVIREWAYLPGLRGRFARLSSGLVSLGEGRLPGFSKIWSLITPETSLDLVKQDLKDALTALDRRVVVLVDDLDRLDGDELHAVLRAIRLNLDLPNLYHVMAYDRRQLSAALFPDEKDSSRARDYLAKVVNFEFTLSTPPQELGISMLNRALQPLLEVVGTEATNRFVQLWNLHSRTVFLEALKTPREIRRVAAATSMLWSQLSRDVDLFDLLVLTIIQYRFPNVYLSVHEHKEWFVMTKWSSDPERLFEAEKWKAERARFKENLGEIPGREGTLALRLLTMVFPDIEEKNSHMIPTQETARKNRRLLHPDVFDRYFQMSISTTQIPESSIEDLAATLQEEHESGRRQEAFVKALRKAIEENRINSFFAQWPILEGAVAGEGGCDPCLATDIVLGLGSISDELPEEGFGFLSLRHMAAVRAIELIRRLPDNEAATKTLEEVVEKASSVGFSGYLASESRRPRDQENPFSPLSPDSQRIVSRFTQRIRARYGCAEKPPLLRGPTTDLVAALFWADPTSEVQTGIYGELKREPELLPKLLELVISLGPRGPGEYVVFEERIGKLAEQLSVPEVHEITKRLALEAWEQQKERELVKVFREWVRKNCGEGTELQALDL